MGGRHEQQRTDRDSYLDILYENIEDGKTHNFIIRSTLDTTPYDASSDMQYGLRVSKHFWTIQHYKEKPKITNLIKITQGIIPNINT